MDRTSLPPGTQLGDLEVIRVLAVGGFGIVYLARDRSLDRVVAVKEFMPTHLARRIGGEQVELMSTGDAETYRLGLRSFVDEAKLLARLSHPSIVKVHSFWEANGTAYMVMPYLRGPTLGDIRRSMSEAPTEVWLRSVVDPLLDALGMLHAEGICHRDISPDNVVLSEAGLPVLLDFGAARTLVGDQTQSVTAVLKPSYAPIEQYAAAKHLRQGPWTDLYALAALVTFLIDGAPPPASTARCVHDDMQPLARRRIPDVTRQFLAAMDWALELKPRDRPQSVAQFRNAIDAPRPSWTLSKPRIARTTAIRALARKSSDALANLPFARTVRMHAGDSLVIPVSVKWLTRRNVASVPWAPAAVGAAVALIAAWCIGLVTSGGGVSSVQASTLSNGAAVAADVASKQASINPLATRSPGVVNGPSLADLNSDSYSDPYADASGNARTGLGSAVPGASQTPNGSRAPLVLATPLASAIAAPLSPVIGGAVSSAMRLADASEDELRHADAVQASPASRHASARPQRRNGRAAQSQKKYVERLASAGPAEICASRNFFIRPYCVQRQCDDSRFKGRAECVQLRPVARFGQH